MNFKELMTLALRSAPASSTTGAVAVHSEEQVPAAISAGDVLTLIFTVLATILFTVGVGKLLPTSADALLYLFPMAMLLVFSELFLRRRNNALASSVYPWAMGCLFVALSVTVATPMGHVLSTYVLLCVGGVAWALTGLFYWWRYQAPSAVCQVWVGLLMAMVIPALVFAVSKTGSAAPGVAAFLMYGTALWFGLVCAWMGRKFDQLDRERTKVYSKIAFWFHSKGAMCVTAGLLLPYSTLVMQKFPQGAEVVMGALCLLAGGLALFCGLKWDRKYYAWAGAVCTSMGLIRLTPVDKIWLVLLVTLCGIALLYSWDALSRRVQSRFGV